MLGSGPEILLGWCPHKCTTVATLLFYPLHEPSWMYCCHCDSVLSGGLEFETPELRASVARADRLWRLTRAMRLAYLGSGVPPLSRFPFPLYPQDPGFAGQFMGLAELNWLLREIETTGLTPQGMATYGEEKTPAYVIPICSCPGFVVGFWLFLGPDCYGFISFEEYGKREAQIYVKVRPCAATRVYPSISQAFQDPDRAGLNINLIALPRFDPDPTGTAIDLQVIPGAADVMPDADWVDLRLTKENVTVVTDLLSYCLDGVT